MDARAHLEEMSRGFMHSAILLAAGWTGIFEALGTESHSPGEVAARTGLDRRAVETVLRALASEGILSAENGRFALEAEYAPLLLAASPATQINIFNHNFNIMQRWVQLDKVLQSGQPAPCAEVDPARAARNHRAFICGMADISRSSSLDVANKFDFSRYRRLLDVGGGPGTHALTFAQRFPQLHAVIFDLPPTVEIAREEIAKWGLGDRVTTQPGDFMIGELGEGYDLVYISNIIHMMGPDETARLIEKSRRALAPGGTLIIKDFFLDEDFIHPQFAALFAVNMLVGTQQGRSYSVGETREMMQRAGFVDFEVIDVALASRLAIGHLP